MRRLGPACKGKNSALDHEVFGATRQQFSMLEAEVGHPCDARKARADDAIKEVALGHVAQDEIIEPKAAGHFDLAVVVVWTVGVGSGVVTPSTRTKRPSSASA